jgi:hypothetical protein
VKLFSALTRNGISVSIPLNFFRRKTPMNFFKKILSGVEWFGKEIGKGFSALPKIIKLTEDGEKVAKAALPQAIVVLNDSGALATAIVKDSGVFVKGFGDLVAAIETAAAAKALNIADDEAVIVAFKAFVADFNVENVKDIIAAQEQLVEDTKTLDATVLAGLKQLEADAKS